VSEPDLHGGVPGIDEGGPEEGHVFHREAGSTPRAELLTSGLLLGCAAFGVAFVVILLALPRNTQLQGIALGGAFALLAAALVVAAKRVIPREMGIEERPQLAHPEARPPVERTLNGIGTGVSRRKLLGTSAAAAGGSLAAALAIPVTSLGPSVGESIAETPWHRGRRLVTEDGLPLTVDDIPFESFVTAFPEGADKRELGSSIVVVREDPKTLHLPPGRRDWAPGGVLAFSKICTHAGCAIALYRQPLYEPTSQPPGLACPCHYSVFDTRSGGKVVAGPAGRPLPQLPLMVGSDGHLQAAGGFSGQIGPSWWGVRS
jgi:ubiquinol-cytochrome c reductase iron-sulfur subunit